MKALLRLLATGLMLALGASGIPAPPASAATGTVGSPDWIAVGAGATYENCVNIPFDLKAMSAWADSAAVSWGSVYRFYNYDVSLSLIGPDGTSASSSRVIRSADMFSAFGDDSGSFFSCSGAGNYTVQATGFWCPVDYASSHPDCRNVAFSRTFTMRPAATQSVLKGKRSASLRGKLKLSATVSIERSTGYFPADGIPVVLQYKRGKRWISYQTSSASNGTARFSVRFANRGTFVLRTLVKQDDYYGTSISKVRKVRVR